MDDLAHLQGLPEQANMDDVLAPPLGAIPMCDEAKSECRATVLSIFPDIDPDHLTGLCEERLWSADGVIECILNQQENGVQYPKASKTNLKRKRQDEDDVMTLENAAKKWDNEERRQQRRESSYLKTSYAILQQFFPQLYMEDVRKYMELHGKLLYPTYLGLSRAVAQWDDRNPPFRKKTRVCKSGVAITDEQIEYRLRGFLNGGEREALEEFRAARAVLATEAAEAEEKRRKEQEEKDNFEMAAIEGNIADCGCCYVEHALNRMVHCDGEELHWFCRDCARMMAETQIGLAKYRLECMSTDGCTGQFPLHQREIFLDAPSLTALDRIEQEAALREAGIENLETCPFCPFAMEYPPLEEDKEFRCLMPDCKMVSCRACRQETHIPKSCEEAAVDRGYSARHTIEEAMSRALIRMCNKCATPFIKENGCNKMTCTKCRNIQCYTCSKSCDYTHFNDTARGGKAGQCPLFDNEGTDARHAEEVKLAEEEARSKVLEENTDVDVAFLEIKTSESVKKAEEQRLKQDGHRGHRIAPGAERVGVRRMQEMIHERGRMFWAPRAAPEYPRGPDAPDLPLPAQAPLPVQADLPFPIQQNPAAPLRPFYEQPYPNLEPAPQALPAAPHPAPRPADRLVPRAVDHLAPRPADRPAPHPAPGPAPRLARRPEWAAWGAVMPKLDQAMSSAVPGIQHSMPPGALPAGQVPHGVANENPYRARNAAPQDEPLNNFLWADNDPFGLPPLPLGLSFDRGDPPDHPATPLGARAPMSFPDMPPLSALPAMPAMQRLPMMPVLPAMSALPDLPYISPAGSPPPLARLRTPPYHLEPVAEPTVQQGAQQGELARPLSPLLSNLAGNEEGDDAAGKRLRGGDLQELDFGAFWPLGDNPDLAVADLGDGQLL